MKALWESSRASVYVGEHQELISIAQKHHGPRALILDAPYSDRTHAGHDRGTAAINERAPKKKNGVRDTGRARRKLDYTSWNEEDVADCVRQWATVIDGWMVSLTDDVLFNVWRAHMERAKRTTFADVPCCISGMTVRLCGGGPSSQSVHAAVSRPKALSDWPTLPGFYAGPRERPLVVGGKPLWLMEKLITHYTRPGDLVIDSTCGGGTGLVAAVRLGRRALGSDVDEEHAELAVRWLRDGRRPAPHRKVEEEPEDEKKQASLEL